MVLEILTNAYRNACSEGEVEMYRAHVAVLGDSEVFSGYFIDEPRHRYFEECSETGGIKTRQIKSKFNKFTQKTKAWKESVSTSSDLMKEFRNAVLSHIQAKGEMETLQKSQLSSADQ